MTMSEERYRLYKALLLTAFVLGVLVIGWRFAENGRYVQFDASKGDPPDGKLPDGTARYGTIVVPYALLDTQTGKVIKSSELRGE
jgi:hypothetical protein